MARARAREVVQLEAALAFERVVAGDTEEGYRARRRPVGGAGGGELGVDADARHAVHVVRLVVARLRRLHQRVAAAQLVREQRADGAAHLHHRAARRPLHGDVLRRRDRHRRRTRGALREVERREVRVEPEVEPLDVHVVPGVRERLVHQHVVVCHRLPRPPHPRRLPLDQLGRVEAEARELRVHVAIASLAPLEPLGHPCVERRCGRQQRQRRLVAADERDGQRERDVGRGQEGWEEGGVDRHRGGRKTWPQTEGQGPRSCQSECVCTSMVRYPTRRHEDTRSIGLVCRRGEV